MAVKAATESSYSLSGSQKDVLEASAKVVDAQMQMDSSYPELIDTLKMGLMSFPSVSGLSDQDYPGMSELSISLHSLAQLTTIKRIPLPSELVEQFGLMQSNCQMGLFPEISRAWLTIDSNIFLWSFEDGSDLAYYDGVKETILCVGLVKPKPGIFQNFVHYLLCLTTPVEIVVLGVNFTRQSESSNLFEEMHLLAEPLFSYPTDNIHMCAFKGTESGRIFFGGKDGSIYEFVYQAQDSWFSRKCKKINHSSSSLSFLVPSFLSLAFAEDDAILQISVDNSRHILYARFEKGSIQVFNLGSDGNSMNKVTTLHQHTIVQLASSITSTIDKKHFYPIVHISAIEASESLHVHLVAITQAGVRLYFTTNGSFGDSRPYTLSLLHIRLPPGFTANTAVTRPSNVHMAYYRKGFLLLASSQTEDNDVIFSTSNDSFVFCPQLIETHSTVLMDGHAWALAEVSDHLYSEATQKPPTACDPPVLVTQHRDMPRKFVFLSAQGSFILKKPRPVDQLYKLLLQNKGPDNELVKAFFMIHKEAQACAMCLILACSQNLQDKQVADFATSAFFLYGGDPRHGFTPIGDAPMSSSESFLSLSRPSSPMTSATVWQSTPQQQQQQRLSAPFQNLQFSNICSPVRTIGLNSPQNPSQQSILSQQLASASPPNPETHFSGKHNGLYLYFARIMRPLWNLKLVSEASAVIQNSPVKFLISNIRPEDLAGFIQQLSGLKAFFDKNNQSFLNPAVANFAKNIGGGRLLTKCMPSSSLDTSSIAIQNQRKTQSDAELQERISLANFQQLVTYTYEMLALWKIFCEHEFQTIVTILPQDQLDSMKLMSFKDFFVDGKDLSAALTSALINFYLEDNASTSTISHRLRELCPSIYRVEDATMSKAHEMVLNAKNIISKVDREAQLLEALKLCKTISPNLNLGLMCGLFKGTGFYHGIIDLCMSCAQRRDPQGLALHYYKNNEPPEDEQGLQAFVKRMKCYKHIINTISDLMSQSMSHPQSPSVPKVPGPPPTRDPTILTPEEANVLLEQIFEVALKTEDELFHVAMYDWLIENNQTDTLLSIKSHFLENYLKRCTAIRPENSYVLDLLWKYYEKNQNFSAAARVLAKLSEKHGVDMSLAQRIEYLSRAIMCIKSSEMRISSSGQGEFLHELEEKMEVARIQLQMLQALQQMQQTAPVQDAVTTLNSNFHEITQLYEDFAEPYQLSEAKLAIVHCANHHDPALVESLWQNIIDKELLATEGNMPEARIKMLQQKLMMSSQTYISSEKFFPLAFIIRYLELKTCPLNFDCTWVFKTMLSIGISIVDLLSIYNKLYSSKESCWSTSGKPLYLLTVLVHLIAHFAETPSNVPLNERRSFTTFCLDVVSGYLVDLQAMDSAISNVPSLIQDFKSVQHKLERLS